MLHPALGKNRYCGPGALAMLFGCSTDEAAAVLRDVSGRSSIKRIGAAEMLRAIERLGARAHPEPIVKPRAVREWARGCHGKWLVQVTGHYVAIDATSDEIEIGDNQSVTARTLDEFRRGGKRVTAAWSIQ